MKVYFASKLLHCSTILIASVFIVFLTGCISDQEVPTMVVETDPLSTQDMISGPIWQPTDPVPLSPDVAVVCGWRWILDNIENCDARSGPEVIDIRLSELSEGHWFYTVMFGLRLTGGGTRMIPVRVFMNGTVWNQKVTVKTSR